MNPVIVKRKKIDKFMLLVFVSCSLVVLVTKDRRFSAWSLAFTIG